MWILFKIIENLDFGRNFLEIAFLSIFFLNREFGRYFRTIPILVEIFET